MVDETTDASNREQVVLCICWVDANFEIHEDFISLQIKPLLKSLMLLNSSKQ